MGVMAEQARPRFVAITGMSGAGRRAAAHTLEDLGWYTLDNLPPSMLPRLFETVAARGIDRVCVILDVRTRTEFDEIPAAFEKLAEQGIFPQILFLEASDEVIVRRQEHVRRPHPLQEDGPLLSGIQRERRMLASMRASADMVVDTSSLNVHQLAERVAHSFNLGTDERLRLTLMSFGFKHGVPFDADVVLDVRFLPNPHWAPELRELTGLQEEVSAFVLGHAEAEAWLRQVESLLLVMAPGYLREGKRQATVAIGCTGGKHRSTAMTEELADRLSTHGLDCYTLHRDLGRD
jgi:UPF0042 nucleotide-binding protein